MGVFASRSPFRPNPLGLSAVKLENIVLQSPEGPLLRVSGADLLHGTPILDIKPYLPYADCIPQATGGFAGTKPEPRLEVSAARANGRRCVRFWPLIRDHPIRMIPNGFTDLPLPDAMSGSG